MISSKKYMSYTINIFANGVFYPFYFLLFCNNTNVWFVSFVSWALNWRLTGSASTLMVDFFFFFFLSSGRGRRRQLFTNSCNVRYCKRFKSILNLNKALFMLSLGGKNKIKERTSKFSLIFTKAIKSVIVSSCRRIYEKLCVWVCVWEHTHTCYRCSS